MCVVDVGFVFNSSSYSLSFDWGPQSIYSENNLYEGGLKYFQLNCTTVLILLICVYAFLHYLIPLRWIF
jgi:hypothetical protein